MVVSDPLRPNATVSDDGWQGDHTAVDDIVTQPGAGGGDFLTAYEAQGNDNDVIVMGFPNTITGVDEVTNITVWTLGGKVGNNSPEVDVNMGGWQGYQECNLGGANWTSDSFNGNWTQADLDGLQVAYRADVPDKLDGHLLDVVYVIVTYSGVPPGYGHDYMGVPAANIGSVSGVPTANIGSIKGV